MKEKRFEASEASGTYLNRQSVQNDAECCNRELLGRLEVQVMKEKRFEASEASGNYLDRQGAQIGAECCNRELLRRLEVRVMKEKRFQINIVEVTNYSLPAPTFGSLACPSQALFIF